MTADYPFDDNKVFFVLSGFWRKHPPLTIKHKYHLEKITIPVDIASIYSAYAKEPDANSVIAFLGDTNVRSCADKVPDLWIDMTPGDSSAFVLGFHDQNHPVTEETFDRYVNVFALLQSCLLYLRPGGGPNQLAATDREAGGGGSAG